MDTAGRPGALLPTRLTIDAVPFFPTVPFHREFVRREFDALYAMHLDRLGHDAETS
jgi:hypothetical protein